MTSEEYNRLLGLIQNPPPGSAIERAKEFGVDLTLTLESLRRTPQERVDNMAGALRLLEEIERARTALETT
jgi:hypothetical protein